MARARPLSSTRSLNASVVNFAPKRRITTMNSGFNTNVTTKSALLSQILIIQERCVEYLLPIALKTLMVYEMARINALTTIDVTDETYGAVGDGSTDDTDAIQAACTAAGVKETYPNGANVYFPYTADHYKISDEIYVPADVNIIGARSKLYRYHTWEPTATRFFKFGGNNVVTKIISDGGWAASDPRVPLVDGYTAAENHSLFVDWDCPISTGIIYYDNEFYNSNGTHTSGTSNSIMYKNTYGEYGDHCVYGGGGRSGGIKYGTDSLIISDNTIVTTVSTRDAIKSRNQGEKIIVANNYFDIPEGELYSFSLGDPNNVQGDLQDISFAYNHVVDCATMGLIGAGNTPTGQTYGTVDNISVSNNMIDNCDGYGGAGGSVWAATTNLDYFNNSNVEFNGNTFNEDGTGRMPWMHVTCCQGNGLNFKFINNNCHGGSTNYSLMPICGNVNLDILKNTIAFSNGEKLILSPYVYCAAGKANTEVTVSRTINIKGNTMSGTGNNYLYYEYEDSDTPPVAITDTYLTDKITFNIKDNIITKASGTVSLNIHSNLTDLIQARMCISGNTVTIGGSPSSIGTTNYPSGYLSAS